MRCPSLAELPPPPAGKTGWPWTEETPRPTLEMSDGRPWPRISIVTASFNQGEFIEKTIRSVLLQGYPNLEYIIIDGGSTDNSVGIIGQYGRWLTHWVSEPDRGAVHACTKGFARATGEVFGIMCADDFYTLGGVLKLVELRRTHPDSVAWVGGFRLVDVTGDVLGEIFPFIRDRAGIGDWGVGNNIGGVACFFDSETFRRVGGHDERFRHASDGELWVRLAKVGSFALVDDIVAVVRNDPNSLSRRDWPGEVAAKIALNYVNGYLGTAKTILARYAADEGLKSARGCGLLSPDELVKAMGRGALAKAVALRLTGGLKRRLGRVFRVGSR